MENASSIKDMLKNEDPYVRRDACEAICESRTPEFIQDLVDVLKDENPGVKEAALNALTSIGGQPVARAVAPLLRLQDASLRNIGIEILEQIGPEALDTIATLLNDRDDDVVKFAVDILANIKEDRAIDLLCALSNHKNPNVRASVAVCLGRIRAVKAIPVLMKALKDEEEWVRFSAIEGLGLMQDGSTLEPLIEIIEEGSGVIKEAAIEAVGKTASCADAAHILTKLEGSVKKGKIINVGAIVELMEKAEAPGSNFKPSREFKETYFRFFSEALDENEKSARIKALAGLGLMRLQEGLPKIFAFLDTLKEIDDDTESLLVNTIISIAGRGPLPQIIKDELKRGGKSLKVIVKALAGMKSEDAVPLLEDLMNKVAKHELREIVSALEAIGSNKSVDVLKLLLANPDGHTRKIAARALCTLAGPNAAEDLFAALKKEQYRDVMEEITDVLARIPTDGVKKGLCGLLSDESEKLREMGARALGLIGDEEALKFLNEAVRDSSPSVRKMAYNSMTRLGIPDAVDMVVKGLKDTDDDVKLSVLKALGGWYGDKIKAALVEALRDRNIWVRYHAVLLLGDMGESDTERLVQDMLINDEAPVKAAAAKALERMGAVNAVGVLEQFIDHPDPSVRAAVENAIGALRC